MFNKKIDNEKIQFGLNKDYLRENVDNPTKILLTDSINYITSLYNPDLDCANNSSDYVQLSLF
jgi:hypothetical protein